MIKTCKRASIAEIHFHGKFNSYTFENDIALLKLSTYFKRNEYITEIAIQKRDMPIPGTFVNIDLSAFPGTFL